MSAATATTTACDITTTSNAKPVKRSETMAPPFPSSKVGPTKRGAIDAQKQRSLFWDRMPTDKTSFVEEYDTTEPEHLGIQTQQEKFQLIDPFKAFQNMLKEKSGHVYSLTAPQPWPLRTDIWCWNCAAPFKGRPYMSPLHYHDETYSFSGCVGVFCSPGCTKRWIMSTIPSADAHHRIFVLHIFLERVMGMTESCEAAPLAYMLQHFGGTMTVEDYRHESIKQIRTTYEWIRAPRYLPESMLVRIVKQSMILEEGEATSQSSFLATTTTTTTTTVPSASRTTNDSNSLMDTS